VKILIVDDHPLLLKGTVQAVRDRLPTAQVETTQTAQNALQRVAIQRYDLVMVDLSIPNTANTPAHIDHGLNLLTVLLQQYPQLNVMVQSSHLKALVRIWPEIENHQGGFTLADKAISTTEFLARMEWAIAGLTHTKDLHTDLAFKPEWFETLELAFKEGLQDKAIAQKMHKSERNIRHYWTKIQDALSVYPEEGKNLRAMTYLRARELGLLD
jgi:DNA-binding NarL/FixJ family response regulator